MHNMMQEVGTHIGLKWLEEVKPRLHVFGHIHGSYGTRQTAETPYINAGNMNSALGLVNKPVVVDIENG
ncbi:MAG: hypothetical protein AAFY71_10535 [Bacteroidota bacterium]